MQNNDNQTNQKDPNNRGQIGFESISPGLCSIWLGMRDSNPRMHGPEPCALPLGQSPITELYYTLRWIRIANNNLPNSQIFSLKNFASLARIGDISCSDFRFCNLLLAGLAQNKLDYNDFLVYSQIF